MRNPTIGLARTYKIGKMEVINPITSGPIPSCLPKTFIWGKIGPIAANNLETMENIFKLRKG